MNIGIELAEMAKEKGICEEWYHDMLSIDDKDQLIGLFVKGIDFCLSNDFPSNDYIRANFVGTMEKHNVFLDTDLALEDPRKVVALGKCTGIVESGQMNILELFCKHESDMVLIARESTFVMVDIFDNAKLSVIAGDDAKVCVNKYGNAQVHVDKYNDATVKIKEKNKKTY